jgi:hypothetical protein
MIAEPLIAQMDRILKTHSRNDDFLYRIHIEDYAVKDHGCHFSSTCEFTGIVKYLLGTKGYRSTLLSNTTAKAFFAGDGHARKHRMFEACRRWYPFVTQTLETHFQWSYDRAREAFQLKYSMETTMSDEDENEDNDSQRRSNAEKRIVEAPTNDIIDSFALMLCPPVLKKQDHKRKRDHDPFEISDGSHLFLYRRHG